MSRDPLSVNRYAPLSVRRYVGCFWQSTPTERTAMIWLESRTLSKLVDFGRPNPRQGRFLEAASAISISLKMVKVLSGRAGLG
jgi:hypothetical protein